MLSKIRKLVVLLLVLAVLPISCSAVEAWTSKHTYGSGESIRLRVQLEDDETGYRVNVVDRNGRSTTFERYDLESDETYTIRMAASRTTGRREVTIRAYDEDGDLTDRDTLHFHVSGVPTVGGTEKGKSSGSSSNGY
jgi:hypothetical protein